MRHAFALLGLLVLLSGSVLRSQPLEPALLKGLELCLTNGIETGVRAWYADRSEVGAEMSAKVERESAKVGGLIDTEVVATQVISRRVTRYFVALYHTQGTVWIRVDRYLSRDKPLFMPLKCSTNPDDILPGYITDFRQ